MATIASAPPLSERADIHKSCKSLESLLNILNDYCEAVGAVVLLQKKLAKALRETAGLKATGEVAAHALNGSAIIFEALSEIDNKYTKLADKEYDSISTEVKKWFKKLVKEEKVHDEKMDNANAKIKQAGQLYEKKSKKKSGDVSEEHARYINLISALGPEISQEKYNHALHITQRHTTTTFSVAACLARIADAEWLKACEGVRRFAPTIGHLGQWRALCEGGWTNPVPKGLPDADVGEEPQPPPSVEARNSNQESGDVEASRAPHGYLPPAQEVPPSPVQQRQPLSSPVHSPPPQEAQPSPVQLRQPLPSGESPALQRQTDHFSDSPSASADKSTSSLHPPGAFDTLKPPFFDPVTGSVRSLSAFPAPPTHFPIPPARQETQVSLSPSQSSSSNPTASSVLRFSESPISANEDLLGGREREQEFGPSTSQQSLHRPAETTPRSIPPSPERTFQEKPRGTSSEQSSPVELRRPLPVRASTALEPIHDHHEISAQGANEAPAQWHDSREPVRYRDDDREFGVQRSSSQNQKARTYDGLRLRSVERTDTGTSNGSIVAAMRNRYSLNAGSTSPPPRELPRIPLSVTDLASRYQSGESPTPYRPRAGSPPGARLHSFPLDAAHSKQDRVYYPERASHRPAQNSIATSTPSLEEDAARRRRQRNEQTDLNLREKEQELFEREREIQAQAKELERERLRLNNIRDGVGSSSASGKLSGGVVGGEPYRNDIPRSPVSPLRPRRTPSRQEAKPPLSQTELDGSESPTHLRPRSKVSGSLASGDNQEKYNGQQLQSQLTPFPSHQSSPRSKHGDDDYRYGEERQSLTSASPHAPYCGCDTCSVSKYRTSSSSTADTSQGQGNHSRPQVPVTGNVLRSPVASDKPKSGWMRRLSIPGGLSNAFNLDSKRSSSGLNYALGSGVSSNTATSKGHLFSDGRKNSSASNLLRPPELDRMHEDGRFAGGNGARRS